MISGYFNTGVVTSMSPNLAGGISGLFNFGSLMSGLFSIDNLA